PLEDPRLDEPQHSLTQCRRDERDQSAEQIEKSRIDPTGLETEVGRGAPPSHPLARANRGEKARSGMSELRNQPSQYGGRHGLVRAPLQPGECQREDLPETPRLQQALVLI